MSKRTHQRTLFGGLQPEEVFFKGVGLYEQVLNKYMNENRNCGDSRESLQKRAKAFWVELKNPLPLGDVACPISEYLREVETPAKKVARSQPGFFEKNTPEKHSIAKQDVVMQQTQDKTHSPALAGVERAPSSKGRPLCSLCVSCSLTRLFLVSVFAGAGSSKVLFSDRKDDAGSVEFRLFLGCLSALIPRERDNGVQHYLANNAFAALISPYLSRYLQNSFKSCVCLQVVMMMMCIGPAMRHIRDVAF